MGRPPNTEVRRRQIVDGLLAVMARKGFEGATIAEVAKVAGLAPGLVHYHFKDKQEILLALVAQLSDVLEKRLEGRLSRCKTARERLDAYVDAHLALGADSDPKAVASWVALGAEAIRQAKVKQAYLKAVQRDYLRLHDLVQAALETQDELDLRIPDVATPVYAAIQGYYVVSATSPVLVPEGSAAERVKQVAAGLLAEAVRRKSR